MGTNLRNTRIRLTEALFAGLTTCIACTAQAAGFPGGILESPSSATVRPLLTQSQIQAFLPTRGKFTFPAPYNTQGVRLTNASDCGGGDCLRYVGYSYWRNMNNHVGSDTMYVFLGMDRSRGGGGPTLFSYNKSTEAVSNLGPLFDANNALSWASGEGWYFSATQPTKLYLNDGARMLRYDILSKQMQTVYDASTQYGSGKTIWQMHSSDDDKVHSATLRDASGYLGCLIYHEDSAQFQYFPKVGDFDECNLDRSGHYAVSLENTQGAGYGLDMRIFDLSNGSERKVLDQNGAVGHADMGYNYIVGSDNYNAMPNAILTWDLTKPTLSGTRVFYNNDWSTPAANHISHTNAKPGVAMTDQYACGSNASSSNSAWANEVVCFRLDGSLNVLVVAPVMTNMSSSVGGDDYSKEPKGNLDVTGQYFIWTSNAGGSHFDAFIGKVPSQLLMGNAGSGGDTSAPVVTMTAPANGATVSGAITVAATATDNVAVVGVQFMLDGVKLASEMTSAPYALNWNTSTATAGAHVLTAVARDAAGNKSTSNAISLTISGSNSVPPAISNVVAAAITSSSVTISWTTNELSDSQIEYGFTSSYGHLSTLSTNAVLAHSVSMGALLSGTVYHYRVRSRDLYGNLAVSADASFSTADSTAVSFYDVEDVAWTGLINTTVSGTTLTKTGGCDGCADAGSLSLQQITSGTGYMEFTVNDPAPVRFIGLNNNSTGTSATELPFSLKLVAGKAEVREKNLYRANTPVVTGDVLRISVNAGTVKYAKNGNTFYTSAKSASYPLRVDTSLFSLGSALNKPLIAGASTIQNVSWTNRINTSFSGRTLTKTSGCDGCEDASAVSQQKISKGNGYLSFLVAENRLVRYVGLNNSDTGSSASQIPFALKLVSGYAEVRENDVYRADTPIVVGDVLRIRVYAGKVSYSKNGVVFYTSTAVPSYPLLADTTIINMNASVSNAIIATTP